MRRAPGTVGEILDRLGRTIIVVASIEPGDVPGSGSITIESARFADTDEPTALSSAEESALEESLIQDYWNV